MLHATKLLTIPALAAATLALASCGRSDKASDAASADNVEMPAEEAMSGLAGSAMPLADPSATATDQPEGADASAQAADSAAEAVSGPGPDAPLPTATASPAAPIRM
jgi:hypothetical protein